MSEVSFDALVPYGFDDRVLALYRSVLDGDPVAVVPETPLARETPLVPETPLARETYLARVTRVARTACFAVGSDGEQRSLRTRSLPAVGDWILAAEGAVCDVLPRWSQLTRLGPSGELQTLAANVDLILITTPADRASVTRVERELALAWDSGAVPLVVVTKADLGGEEIAAQLSLRLSAVEVMTVSAATGAGVATVGTRVREAGTAALLGPSGAGKSTLANALLSADVLATAAVRDGDARGRHTTTSRQLVTLPGGGVLIDTPGLRSLGLHGDVEVGASFPDIEELAAGCRFSDCRHDGEPGCLVLGAVQSGGLDPDRLRSFHKLTLEAAAERRRRDPFARSRRRRAD